jgi:hypothetical protein
LVLENNTTFNSRDLINLIQNEGGKFSKPLKKAYKQKWFDQECEKARIKSFKMLKLCRNIPNSVVIKKTVGTIYQIKHLKSFV